MPPLVADPAGSFGVVLHRASSAVGVVAANAAACAARHACFLADGACAAAGAEYREKRKSRVARRRSKYPPRRVTVLGGGGGGGDGGDDDDEEPSVEAGYVWPTEWYYCYQGEQEVQGPYGPGEMRGWYYHGYFEPNEESGAVVMVRGDDWEDWYEIHVVFPDKELSFPEEEEDTINPFRAAHTGRYEN